MRTDPKPRRPDWPGLALLAASLLYLHLFALRGVGWIDEGFALNAARRIAGGETLYRDFFAPYGPGRHYLLAWAFDLLGVRLAVARSLWILLLGLTAVAIYRVGRRLLPTAWAVTAAACFVVFPPQAFKVFTPLAYAAVCLLTLRALERPEGRRWLAAGVGVGLAGLFRFELWGAGAVILLAGWLRCRPAAGRRRRTALLAAGGGMLIPILPPLVAYGIAGLLPGIVRYEAMQKAQLAQFFSLPLPSPLRAWTEGIGALGRAAGAFDATAAWVPACLAALALLRVARRWRAPARTDPALLVVAAACALSQVAYFSRPDFDHLLHVTPLAVLLLVYFMHRARRRAAVTGTAHGWWAVAAGGAFLILFAVSAIVRHPMEGFSVGRIRVATERVDGGPRGTFWDTPYQAAVFRGVRAFVDSLPGSGESRAGEIAFLKFGGFWYFMLDLRSPIPEEPLSSYSGGDGGGTAAEKAVIRALEDAPVRYVLLERTDPRYAILPPFRTIHPLLASYLDRAYRDTGVRLGEWVVLRRTTAEHGP